MAQPFVLAGWAFDAIAPSGTGIRTIHVWAFQSQPWDYHLPVPAFVGVPNFGSRPDVGAAFGTQFTPSGFELVVSGLPPGAYQLSLFGWVDAIGGFGIVRILALSGYRDAGDRNSCINASNRRSLLNALRSWICSWANVGGYLCLQRLGQRVERWTRLPCERVYNRNIVEN